MDPVDFCMEMGLAGCIQLFHPLYPQKFYVLEQKLENQVFIPLEKGAHIFFIDTSQEYAKKETCHDLDKVYSFLEQKIHQEGWRVMDEKSSHDIRKKNFVKWQFCSLIK